MMHSTFTIGYTAVADSRSLKIDDDRKSFSLASGSTNGNAFNVYLQPGLPVCHGWLFKANAVYQQTGKPTNKETRNKAF